MSEVNMKEYRKNFKKFMVEYNKLSKEEQNHGTKVFDIAESFGIKVDRTGKGIIFSPEILERGSTCQTWEYEYKVPKGNYLHNKGGDCGIGCLCVDKGADKPSLDRLNSIPKINVVQVCDGSKEHKPRTSKIPFLAFEYKAGSFDIEQLRGLCSSSSRIIVNDKSQSQIISNLCTNKRVSVKATKQERDDEKARWKGKKNIDGKLIKIDDSKANVLIFGKSTNDRQFFSNAANVISNFASHPITGNSQNLNTKKTSSGVKKKPIKNNSIIGSFSAGVWD